MTSSLTRITHLSVFRASTEPIKKFVVGIVLSPVIIGVFWIIMVLFALVVNKARGAIVITSITETQYNDIKATTGTSVSWTAIFNAGSVDSDTTTESRAEIVAKTGSQNVLGQYTWTNNRDDINDNVYVEYDLSGNLNLSAGASSVFSVQPTIGFNTILIRLSDIGTGFGGTDFIGGSINSQAFGFNVSANGGYSYAKIDLGANSPDFELGGLFKSTLGASMNSVQVKFEGVNFEGTSPDIPEPSVSLLALIGVLSSIFIRRR